MATGAGFVCALPFASSVLHATSATPIVLTAGKGTAPLAVGIKGAKPTNIWGYNGSSPGPVLRCRAGEKLAVRLINKLDQPTTLHWHGVRIENAMDGVPGLTQKAVMPGESFDYEFTAPDAGTYWYHTHNRTWEQLARGMYGLLIVEERDKPAFDTDIALAIDDWRLGPDGQIEEKSFGSRHDWAHGGRMGNWLTVNGRSNPAIKIKRGDRVRLRLVNTANARIFKIALGGEKVHIIALDGRPIKPQLLSDGHIELAPAQRADIAFIATGAPGTNMPLMEVSYRKPYAFAHIEYEEGTPFDGKRVLPELELGSIALDLRAAKKYDLVMAGGAMGNMMQTRHKGQMMDMRELISNGKMWALNGIAGDLDTPMFDVPKGQVVIVNMTNETMWPHAMHIHGHHFKVISRNNKSIANSPWRDTVLMQRREKVEIAFAADNPGKWLFHCHMVEHTAGGMATWFNVKA